MKKIFFLALTALACGLPTAAQISTGNPSAKQFKTGNRAQAGDFGIYLGVSSNMFKDMFDKNIKFETPMPLVNLKYMVTDQIEARVGLEFSKTRETMKGDILTGEESETTEAKYKVVEAKNRITPGVAYHFSKHNIIDVYAGAEALVGWERKSNYATIDDDEYSTRRASFQLGAGAFIGLQAYIGNLPLAIGLEYGLSTLWESRLRNKLTGVDGEGNEQITYSSDEKLLPKLHETYGQGESNPFDSDWDEMKASRGKIGNKFAITLTYFFK